MHDLKALAGSSLAAGEAHITFRAKIVRALCSEPEDDNEGIERFMAAQAKTVRE